MEWVFEASGEWLGLATDAFFPAAALPGLALVVLMVGRFLLRVFVEPVDCSGGGHEVSLAETWDSSPISHGSLDRVASTERCGPRSFSEFHLAERDGVDCGTSWQRLLAQERRVC